MEGENQVPGGYNSGNTVAPPLAYPANASDYGDWIAGNWRWQLFATLTFRDPVESGTHTAIGFRHAERELGKWWKSSIRERSQTAYAFFSMEPHRDRSTPHFHGLLGGLPPYLVRDAMLGRFGHDPAQDYLWREWFESRGIARIDVVDSVVPAAHYVAKYMLKGSGKLYAFGSLGSVFYRA